MRRITSRAVTSLTTTHSPTLRGKTITRDASSRESRPETNAATKAAFVGEPQYMQIGALESSRTSISWLPANVPL